MRLLPPHWIGFLLALPVSLVGKTRISMDELWVTLAWWLPGMQNFWEDHTFSKLLNPPAWAVTPLLIGGLLLAALRMLQVRRWGLQALVGLFCLTVMMRMGIDLVRMPPENFPEQLLRHSALLPRLLEVLAGAWAGILWSGEGAERLKRWMKRDAALAALLCVVLGLLLVVAKMGGKEAIFIYTHGLYLPLGLVLVTAAYANEGSLNRVCSHPWIVHGGNISIYVWMTHFPVSILFYRCGYRAGIPGSELGKLWGVLLTLFLTIALASLCERVIRSLMSTGRPTLESRAHAAG